MICTGLGAWEQDGLPSYYKLKEAFDQKQIPAWFAEWGHDVAHDWGMVAQTNALFPRSYESIKGVAYELSCNFTLLPTKFPTV